jgi:hypothetical protein
VVPEKILSDNYKHDTGQGKKTGARKEQGGEKSLLDGENGLDRQPTRPKYTTGRFLTVREPVSRCVLPTNQNAAISGQVY